MTNERELEDYICENIESFIEKLKEIYKVNDIQFLGRQIKIGYQNIADLIFYSKHNLEGFEVIDYYIVELKFRKLEPKDLAQLNRYMNTLENKVREKYEDKEVNVYGIFVSTGANEEMKYILDRINSGSDGNRIISIAFETKLDFKEENFWFNEDYINNLELDNRIEEIYE